MVVLVQYLRWRLLRSTPYPTGLDGGNWLAYGHAILGEHLRSPSLVSPPVVPLAAVASERILGTYNGIKVLALIAAAAPSIGAYVLLYAWGLRWRAVVLAGFLAASAGTGEAMAWGGYPQLIALGLLPVFICALEYFLTSRSLWGATIPALVLLCSLGTSTIIGPITAVIGACYLVARYAFLKLNRDGNTFSHVLGGIALGIVFVLPVVPMYAGLLPGVAANEQAKSASPLTVLGAIINVSQDLSTFWVIGLALALASSLVLFAKLYRLALLSLAILLPSILLLATLREVRFAYLVPLGIVVGLGAWWQFMEHLPSWTRSAVDASLITFLTIDVLIGTQYFAFERDFYTVLNPGIVEGFSQLDKVSTPDQTIAVSALARDWPLGWWVEGAAHRRTIYAGNPVWLAYADEKSRNAIANRIFSSNKTLAESLQEARGVGAAYLFVDKTWSGYAYWRNNGYINPTKILYENDAVMIIATGG